MLFVEIARGSSLRWTMPWRCTSVVCLAITQNAHNKASLELLTSSQRGTGRAFEARRVDKTPFRTHIAFHNACPLREEAQPHPDRTMSPS